MFKAKVKGILGRFQGSPNPQPNWADILRRDSARWKAARASTRNGSKVLIATSVGGHTPGTIIESMLAVALTLRGAEVHILLCDELLPACLQATVGRFSDAKEFSKYGSSYVRNVSSLPRTCLAR
jgi:hypothetical protein